MSSYNPELFRKRYVLDDTAKRMTLHPQLQDAILNAVGGSGCSINVSARLKISICVRPHAPVLQTPKASEKVKQLFLTAILNWLKEYRSAVCPTDAQELERDVRVETLTKSTTQFDVSISGDRPSYKQIQRFNKVLAYISPPVGSIWHEKKGKKDLIEIRNVGPWCWPCDTIVVRYRYSGLPYGSYDFIHEFRDKYVLARADLQKKERFKYKSK